MRPLNWQITLHFMEAYLIFILVYILFIYNKEWETFNDSVPLTYWIHLLCPVDQKTINVIPGLTNKQGLNFPGLKRPNHLDFQKLLLILDWFSHCLNSWVQIWIFMSHLIFPFTNINVALSYLPNFIVGLHLQHFVA